MKDLKTFNFWCQKVLPLVYDDSLSYYELLCKVVDYINNRYHFNNTNELVVLIDNTNSFDIPQLHENVIKLLKSIDSRGSIQKKSQLEREILSIEKEELKKWLEEAKTVPMAGSPIKYYYGQVLLKIKELEEGVK